MYEFFHSAVASAADSNSKAGSKRLFFIDDLSAAVANGHAEGNNALEGSCCVNFRDSSVKFFFKRFPCGVVFWTVSAARYAYIASEKHSIFYLSILYMWYCGTLVHWYIAV